MNELQAQYTALTDTYNSLIDEAVQDPTKVQTNFSQIVDVARQRTEVVDQMLQQVALSNQSSSDIQQLRDELVTRLRRIQQDYNGLQTNTDKLETLRRIRTFQDTSWKSTLAMYLTAFVVLVILVFVAILFARQRDSATMSPTTTTMRPAFT